MKITIDTKEDSAEDIRKVISLLSTLIGESAISLSPGKSQSSPNIFENSPAADNIFGSMFGDSSNVASAPADSPAPSAVAAEQIVIIPNDTDDVTEEERKAADLIMEY